ncbi:MAG: uL15 family ribosomal protein [Patescibacteria group bacterium]|jgi:large subunit ribosomal protein L15
MLTLSQLTTNPKKHQRRLGRGNSSGRGTTAGRGTKGQRARTGSRGGLKLMGLKATFKGIPKAKGFVSEYPKYHTINVQALNHYQADSTVKLVGYKVLSTGNLKVALTVCAEAFSKAAQAKIEQAGGKCIICGKPS